MNVWGWSLGSVVLVSLVSFVGLVFMSRGRERLDALLMYLVSLAAGVLLGSAFFHLLPEAWEALGNGRTVPVLFLVGFLGFFFLERFLWAHHHGHGREPVTGRDLESPPVHGDSFSALQVFDDGGATAPAGPTVPVDRHHAGPERAAGRRRDDGHPHGEEGHVHDPAHGGPHDHGSPDGPARSSSGPRARFRPVVVMSLVGDGLHNFIDGMIIAAAYASGTGLGLVATGAVLLHEVPQEAGEFGVLVRGGLSVRRALVLNFLSASMSVVGALVVLTLGGGFDVLTRALLPLTAGNFVYIAAADLIPELHHHHDRRESAGHATMLVVGVVLTFGLTFLRH